MFKTHQSQYDFETTIAKVEESVASQGWKVSGISQLSKSIEKHGGGNLPPVAVLKVCHPDHAFAILNVEKYRHLSTLMPCSIAVYEDDSGAVHIAQLNTALMGMMFGSPVREVMSGPVAQFLDTAVGAAAP